MLKTINKLFPIAALAVVIALPFILIHPISGNEISPTTSSCPTSVYITKPYEGETISGQAIFEAYVPNTMNANEVIFLLNNNIIGSGAKVDQNWRLSFGSSTHPNGSYNLTAQVRFGSDSSACRTLGRNIVISNSPEPTTFHIEAVPNMVSWSGPTNVTIRFIVHVYGISGSKRTDVTSMSAYSWQTSIGTLTASNNEANFFSGPKTGDGEVKLIVTYSGKTQAITFPVQIRSADSTASYPSQPASSTTTPQHPASEITDNGQSLTPGLQYQGDTELHTCLSEKLDNFEKPEDQKIERLKFGDIDKAEGCFARRNFIIPSNLAPVSPDKVLEIKEDKRRVKIDKIYSQSNNSQQAVILSGIAKPNKIVIIYIFSEPLVLAAKTDSTGRWSYTLEDPLEPGNHEAYVTVEGDNAGESIRSPGFAFGVASAVKTKQNPFGLSLLIQNKRDPKTVYLMYIMGAGSILSAAAAALMFINLKHKANIFPDSSSENSDAKE